MSSVAGYDFVLPPGWWAIPTDPAGARASIRELADAKLAGLPRDTAPKLRAELEGRLHRVVANALDVGAVDVFLTVDMLEGFPATASCLVVVIPGERAVPLDEIRARMADGADEDDVVELAGAPALRFRRRRTPPPDDPEELPTVVVEHVLPVPGTHSHVAFVWSAQAEPIADAFVLLFDAIASTVTWRWTDEEPADSAAG